MDLVIGDQEYRLRLQSREALSKYRIAKRLGALLPVTVRGITLNLYGLVGKAQKIFNKVTKTEEEQRIFSIPRQLYENSQGWQWVSGQKDAPIWVPGPIFNLDLGCSISYEGFSWNGTIINNNDTKRIEFEVQGVRSHIRRL